MSSIRLKKQKIVLISGISGALLAIVIACVLGYFWYNKTQEKELALKEEYQAKIQELSLVAEQSNIAYALNQNVARGEKITSSMLTEVYIPNLATSPDLLMDFQVNATNYYARTDITMNSLLVSPLVYEEEFVANDVREGEYAAIQLPSKLAKNDFVDVRIQFPNGEDYVVFGKKRVMDVSGVTLWLDVDEAEILSMSSALVDAYIEEGKLYAIRYVDGEMQTASEITYPVNNAVLDLIRVSPNIVNIAKLNLEKQNRAALETNMRELEKTEREKVRQKEAEYNSVKSQQDKEKALIEANQSTIYDAEIVNEDMAGTVGGGE